MSAGLPLLLLGGFLLGGAWSIWRTDDDDGRRTGPQIVFAVILLVAAVLASAAGVLRLI
ncbi:hypothetical protein QOZ88_16400 [Blastococcus sp. BMG 814]|uniref:PEP-CTERM protein-sorting domain-containing protein n=1 Tax=Blastococcus carthaginiensis TaxID=3050034 RepID=A0ABT9IF53_9ACTN|nr:hypothetical protein [Blastococcus carthaginiensis]MDP5184215.1 hypothetical protein [Blastococcus carthaginiensis]